MRGRAASRAAWSASSADSVPTFVPRSLCFARQISDELLTLMDELLARAAAVRRSNRVFAEQRERNRRIAVRDDGVGQDAGIHLAPADRFGGRRTGETAPDHLIGGDLNEVV